MQLTQIIQGNSPLILTIPHAGVWLPGDLNVRLNLIGRAIKDTDWHVDELYADLKPDVTIIKAVFNRYLIDVNRHQDDQPLYFGQNSTGLCPLTDFDGKPIYLPGQEPGHEEINQRITNFYDPYHDAIKAQISRLKRKHRQVIVYDCHTIRSHIPYLFPGRLSDFNIGTNDDRSCSLLVRDAVASECFKAADSFTSVVNGRFKGGWTVRHYGDWWNNVNAIQMEIAQRTYLVAEASPWRYDRDKAAKLRHVLVGLLNRIERLALSD